MNLLFRMFYLFVSTWFRPKLTSPDQPSILRFRVLPLDIDFNIHMTNGRYLSIADIGRMDVAFRSGLFRHVTKNGWAPVVTFNAVLFRRELRIWQRFELRTQLIYWNDEIQIFEHAYYFVGGKMGGQQAAVLLVAAGFYDRKAKAFVPAQRQFELIGINPPAPILTPRIERFIAAYKAFREEARPEALAA